MGDDNGIVGISLRCSPEMREIIKALANHRGLSVNKYLVSLVTADMITHLQVEMVRKLSKKRVTRDQALKTATTVQQIYSGEFPEKGESNEG